MESKELDVRLPIRKIRRHGMPKTKCLKFYDEHNNLLFQEGIEKDDHQDYSCNFQDHYLGKSERIFGVYGNIKHSQVYEWGFVVMNYLR